MKHNQSSEDYLETVLLLSNELEYVHQIEIARKMGVSQPAVQKALKILKTKGFLDTDGLHIYLTESGKTYAESVYHRHCTIRRFLELHGVNSLDADDDACEMEHGISPATFEMMENYVKNNQN